MNAFRAFTIWLGRVLANAIAGGLAFAVVGAFCGALAGGFIGALSYNFRAAAITKGAELGVYVGGASGVFGVLIYAIAAFAAVPSALLAPFHRLKKRVGLGQLFGTLLACASFLIFELGKSALQELTLSQALNSNDSFYFVCAAPISMILGSIAAAVLKRD